MLNGWFYLSGEIPRVTDFHLVGSLEAIIAKTVESMKEFNLKRCESFGARERRLLVRIPKDFEDSLYNLCPDNEEHI